MVVDGRQRTPRQPCRTRVQLPLCPLPNGGSDKAGLLGTSAGTLNRAGEATRVQYHPRRRRGLAKKSGWMAHMPYGESIPAAGETTWADTQLCGASFGVVTREASTGLTIRRGCKCRRRTFPPVGWASDYAVHWSKQKNMRVGSDTAAAILEEA